MKLTVILHRGTKETAYYGTIRAFVFQQGRIGENILAGRQMSNPDNAKREVINRLTVAYGPVEIDWDERL